MKSPLSTDSFFFNAIGFISTFSLGLALFMITFAFLQGDFSIIGRYLETYAGIQPFLIFIIPVILIASPVWIYKKYQNYSERTNNRT